MARLLHLAGAEDHDDSVNLHRDTHAAGLGVAKVRSRGESEGSSDANSRCGSEARILAEGSSGSLLGVLLEGPINPREASAGRGSRDGGCDYLEPSPAVDDRAAPLLQSPHWP